MKLTEILLTIPEYAPDRFQECADLLRHIEHGDAEHYTPKAARMVAGYLHNYSRAIPPDVRDEIMRSIMTMVPNRFAFIRGLSGMTQATFAGHFGIPQRTIESWDAGVRSCPDYVLDLILYKLNNEGLI